MFSCTLVEFALRTEAARFRDVKMNAMDEQVIRVLLIVDEPDDSLLIRELLDDSHAVFQVECVDRLAPGMELLAQAGNEIDVVLLDLTLPDADGRETFEAMEAAQVSTPVVVMAGQDFLVKGQVDSRLLSRSLQYAIERKRLESALRESEEQHRDLLENAHDLIQSVTPDGRFAYVNRAWREMLGYSEEDVKNLSLFDILHADCQMHCRDVFQHVLAGEDVHNIEATFVASDGRVIDVEGNVSCRFEDGKPRATRAIFRDVTERRRSERRIQQLNEDLERRVEERTRQLAAANAELEAFSYSVCHDLRAPLNTIDGFSLEVLNGYGDLLDEQGKHFLSRVRYNVQQMGRLIDALLSLSRVAGVELHKHPVDLSVSCREILGELRIQNPQHAIESSLQDDVVVHGDSVLLQVVMQNLLSNAWKYSKNRDHPKLEFASEEIDGEQIVFIRDNGTGFDMAYADKLFDPFQWQHSQSEFDGIGIGLATVQRIIHRHGGRVWAHGEVDQGATFFFTLPRN